MEIRQPGTSKLPQAKIGTLEKERDVGADAVVVADGAAVQTGVRTGPRPRLNPSGSRKRLHLCARKRVRLLRRGAGVPVSVRRPDMPPSFCPENPSRSIAIRV